MPASGAVVMPSAHTAEPVHARTRGERLSPRMRTPAGVFERGRPLGAEPLFPEAFHHELQATLGGMIEIAVLHEDVDEGFGRRQHVTATHELVQLHCEVR